MGAESDAEDRVCRKRRERERRKQRGKSVAVETEHSILELKF